MTRCVYCSAPCRGLTCTGHRDLLKIESMRWGGLPMGELHPRDRCALCSSTDAPVQRTVVQSTNAIGYLCIDTSACVRRRSLARKQAA